MILPDFMIRELCENPLVTWSPGAGPQKGKDLPIPDHGPLLTPFDPAFIGPASVDLRVGESFSSPSPFDAWINKAGQRFQVIATGVTKIGPENIPARFKNSIHSLSVELQPGQVLACHSQEYVRLPADVAGHLYMRSTFAREWLDHSVASFIQPGFHGTITYELHNAGPGKFTVGTGMRVMQLELVRLVAAPETPYFAREKSKYRGQVGELRARNRSEEGL